jgi:hypothetical protein
MNVKTFSAALMVAGLLVAAPVLAQTAPTDKQPSAQKQPTQNLVPSSNQSGGNPNYKQKTQSLVPPANQDAWEAGKQK